MFCQSFRDHPLEHLEQLNLTKHWVLLDPTKLQSSGFDCKRNIFALCISLLHGPHCVYLHHVKDTSVSEMRISGSRCLCCLQANDH